MFYPITAHLDVCVLRRQGCTDAFNTHKTNILSMTAKENIQEAAGISIHLSYIPFASQPISLFVHANLCVLINKAL